MTRDDMKALAELIGELVSIKGEIEGLRAENKCLREDRDTWKQLALKNSGKSAFDQVFGDKP